MVQFSCIISLTCDVHDDDVPAVDDEDDDYDESDEHIQQAQKRYNIRPGKKDLLIIQKSFSICSNPICVRCGIVAFEGTNGRMVGQTTNRIYFI